MNRIQANQIVNSIDSLETIKAALQACIDRGPERIGKTGTWQYHANKLLTWLNGNMQDAPPFRVFQAQGNKKLPFYAFSSLALADCPGKGDCVKFCYSLKAWRYPAAFFRQVQNSLLLRFQTETVASAFHAIPKSKTVRLFVDGDFKDVATLRFFMDLCKARPDLRCYGYSKSWHEFITLNASGYEWPDNYLTNASSGSKWAQTGIANAFLALPIVRGQFDAVTVEKLFIQQKSYQGKDKPGSNAYRKAVREKLKALTGSKKVFACPGNCGNCLPSGEHACGSKSFDQITIGIGVH
jgi:hypothetical protein